MKPKFQPTLAAKIDNEDQLQTLRYPLLAMHKYDGIRCVIFGGKILSRTLKTIPNLYIQQQLKPLAITNDLWDGELILPGKNYNDIQSAVMSRDGEPTDFKYVVFDRVLYDETRGTMLWQQEYCNRLGFVEHLNMVARLQCHNACPAPSELCFSHLDVLDYERRVVVAGGEGIILRARDGHYKFGRSTLGQGILMKFKRTQDAEARVVAVEELMHNDNELETDERGYAKRSSHKDAMFSSGMLGSFVVTGMNGDYEGQTFRVSCSSMTHDERRTHWRNYCLTPTVYIGKRITYTYAQNRPGVNAPLETRFKNFREML